MATSHPTPAPGCRKCGSAVRWIRKKARFAFFCGRACESQWRAERWRGNTLRAGIAPANAIAPGAQPWNKGLEGIHLSPATEFKPGHRKTRRLPVGAVTLRTDKSGSTRAWVKVAEPNRWMLRAVKAWQDANGPVRRGCVIHHHDRDTLNDDLSNLRMLTRAQHVREHRHEM